MRLKPVLGCLFGIMVAGARPVSDAGVVAMRSGTRTVILRDPDVGGFVQLYEQP